MFNIKTPEIDLHQKNDAAKIFLKYTFSLVGLLTQLCAYIPNELIYNPSLNILIEIGYVMNNNISNQIFRLRFTVDCYLMDRQILCLFYLDRSNSDVSINYEENLLFCIIMRAEKNYSNSHNIFSLQCLFIQHNEPHEVRGDDTSQQKLVDFYKTHCTHRE